MEIVTVVWKSWSLGRDWRGATVRRAVKIVVDSEVAEARHAKQVRSVHSENSQYEVVLGRNLDAGLFVTSVNIRRPLLRYRNG